VVTDPSLAGKGTVAEPLTLAQRSAANGQVLKWNGTAWAPGTDNDIDNDVSNEIQTITLNGNNLILSKNGGSVTLPTTGEGTGGDNWGTQSVATAPTLRGDGTALSPLDLASQNASEGQVLKFNGYYWAPANDATGGGGLTLPYSGFSLPYDQTGLSISSNASGISGTSNSPDGTGVIGHNLSSLSHAMGVAGYANSNEGIGVYGRANASGGNTIGVSGEAQSNQGIGVRGFSQGTGIVGISTGPNGKGIEAIGNIGLYASGTSGVEGIGIMGEPMSVGVSGMGNRYGIYGMNTNENGWSGYFNGRVAVVGNMGIGVDNPSYKLDVAGTANLSSGISGETVALSCNGAEALWFNGSYFSWGFGASSHNYFHLPVVLGGWASPEGHMLVVSGSAAKTDGSTWSNISDVRLKNITGSYAKGLKEIVALQPVTFTYKEGNTRKLDSTKEQIGFVAQEVQQVFPEAVTTGGDGYLEFNMHAVNVALVNAIKELKAENEKLSDESEKLKAENQELRMKNNEIDQRLSQIERIISASSMK